MAQVDSENSIAMPGAAAPAGALYFKTDVSPEDMFVAIGRLRREARDEVDRLLQFLDRPTATSVASSRTMARTSRASAHRRRFRVKAGAEVATIASRISAASTG